MRVVCDIEANGLKATKIWVIVCLDIDTHQYHIFRNLDDDQEKERFKKFATGCKLWIGHNFLGYDYPTLQRCLGLSINDVAINSIDTLVVSRLVDYPRDSHSLESYGIEFKLEKKEFSDFSKYSLEMEEYCVRDVDICLGVYNKYRVYLRDIHHLPSIQLEQKFQLVVNDLELHGFGFNRGKATRLLDKVIHELEALDREILDAFPPHLKPIREITPTLTQHGTLNRRDFRWIKDGDLTEYNGGPFTRCSWVPFNPSSHKQIVDVLHQAGWSPIDETDTKKDTQREVNRLKRLKRQGEDVDLALEVCYTKGQSQEKYGWKINENNLSTLPATAPPPVQRQLRAARTIARRILFESRRRSLVEWISLCSEESRIHGKFQGIGAWTHRMAHQKPNTANIPNDTNINGTPKLLGGEMRSLWQAPRKRLLVGVDAEGIQLRIFAHYIDDKEFTNALVNGRKDNKTDPHSLNQRILGRVCKSRAASKRFIFALLLGAGIGKLAEILECSIPEAQEALDRLIQRYTGFSYLKQTIIPKDATRGWFIGLDGRKVRIWGNSVGERRHLAMSGYLQNGEKVVVANWVVDFNPHLVQHDSFLVDIIHDEVQVETPDNMDIALSVAEIVSQSLVHVGERLQLKCPLAASYWNEDRKDYTIGTNWKVTH